VSDFGNICTGDGDLIGVAGISVFAAAVFKYSTLCLNGGTTGLESEPAK
jgi:hypothetical protein